MSGSTNGQLLNGALDPQNSQISKEQSGSEEQNVHLDRNSQTEEKTAEAPIVTENKYFEYINVMSYKYLISLEIVMNHIKSTLFI